MAGDVRHCEDVVDASDAQKQCAMIFKSRYEYIHKQLHLSIIEIPNTKVKSVWEDTRDFCCISTPWVAVDLPASHLLHTVAASLC